MPSNGSFWYGGSIGFPGFLYKKNVGVGGKKSTLFAPGGNTTCNQTTNIWNKYTPGSGVGAVSPSTRRAKMRIATSCNKNQSCGKFYSQLGVNWNVVSPYTIDQ
jgi:hypothetical protein